MKRFCLLVLIIAVCLAALPKESSAQTPLTLEPYLSGLSSPVLLLPMPGDSTRELILEQNGHVRLVINGVLQTKSLLDITSRVSSGGERGLLGLAFHSNFEDNRYLFLYYTGFSPTGKTVVDRYTVDAGLASADTATRVEIFTQSQPFPNHNAGMIAFSPVDGYLYIALGDGGSGGDPDNYSQTRTSLLGKMLRIDVDGASPYAIPPDNPFVGDTTTLDEIWAIGLRNPWRWCFDTNGDMYIADVGQGEWEEINYAPASDTGGLNYGWRLKEGDNCYNPAVNCDPLDTLYDPIEEYNHSLGCSVTGGFVYRGCAVPDLDGAYFYGDYCSGRIWSFKYDGSTMTEFTDRTSELGNPGFGLVSFGHDYQGELYLLFSDGDIFKLVPDGVPSQCVVIPSCCEGPSVGNVDASPDNSVTLGDLTAMIDHLFISLEPLICKDEGNTDESPDGEVTLADLTVLIDHLFISLEDLPACPV